MLQMERRNLRGILGREISQSQKEKHNLVILYVHSIKSSQAPGSRGDWWYSVEWLLPPDWVWPLTLGFRSDITTCNKLLEVFSHFCCYSNGKQLSGVDFLHNTATNTSHRKTAKKYSFHEYFMVWVIFSNLLWEVFLALVVGREFLWCNCP